MESTKTIVTNVTLHVPDEGYVPNEISKEGFVSGGCYKFKAVKPGTAVTLPAHEAEAILERHGGEEVESYEGASVVPQVSLSDSTAAASGEAEPATLGKAASGKGGKAS